MTAQSRKQDMETYRTGHAWKKGIFDEARELRIVKRWRDGETISVLAESNGVDNSTISRVLRKHNAERPGGSSRKPAPIDAELEAKVVALLREGLSASAIRARHTISIENIRIISARAGIKRQPGRPPRQSKHISFATAVSAIKGEK